MTITLLLNEVVDSCLTLLVYSSFSQRKFIRMCKTTVSDAFRHDAATVNSKCWADFWWLWIW